MRSKSKNFIYQTETIAEDPQVPILFEPMHSVSEKGKNKGLVLNVLSLFSGCGGMDIGFEGGFSTFSASINEKLTPHFIEKEIDRDTIPRADSPVVRFWKHRWHLYRTRGPDRS